ncbi:hypothetical protein QHT84_10695 [Flavobacterium sp. YZ-48]|uniref:Thoeris protein ThsB TIR-like domain-containing protein n=2 Tax=Flavobacterium sedimenticola TaxID=3043286 RepID=A0ABT6XSC8_9FLAO|nr:TIR domain-containing protein [Flavobacterium sedimenticola]MDI9257880.1 hypothetical protein [Flavobacterium sedimenticola]
MIKSWIHKKEYDVTTITHEEKELAQKNPGFHEKLLSEIQEKIKNSEQLVIILKSPIADTEDSWCNHEIHYAVDRHNLPIIVAYLDTDYILDPMHFYEYWPLSLKCRILSNKASCIHIPFRKEPFKDAVAQFSKQNKPKGNSMGVYSEKAYEIFGIKTS